MKKMLSMLLAASMLLAIAPMAVSAYEEDKIASIEADLKKSDNLAYGKTVIRPETALDQGEGSSWTPANLTDGSLNRSDNGETTGFHSQHPYAVNHSEWAGVDLGSPTAFDTLVIYPSKPSDSDRCPGFPNAFRVDVSSDNIDWKTLTVTVTGKAKDAAQEIFDFDQPAAEPVTVNFPAVTARYVRFVALSLNNDGNGYYLKLSEMAVYKTGYTPEQYDYNENIVEGKTPTFIEGSAHPADDNNWITGGVGLTDGDRYNMNFSSANNSDNYGQFAGFHSSVDSSRLDFYYDLGEGASFDRFLIYPSSTKYSTNKEDNDGLHLPDAIEFSYTNGDPSAEGTVWTKINVSYSKPDSYKAIEFKLPEAINARYFRIAFDVPAGFVKLSELEIYNTAKKITVKPDEGQKETVVKENTNLAPDATVIYSGITPAGGWNPANLNNGAVETDGGFTTNNGGNDVNARLWVGYDLGAVTRINSVVLYSANSTSEEDAAWSGIPKSFEIQVSTDGINWKTVSTVTNDTVPAKMTPYTYSFDTEDAQYVRVLAKESYPKGSDGNNCYIQLAEMQVLYTVTGGGTVTPPPPPTQTGDAFPLLLTVAALALIGCGVVLSKKRRFQ